MIKKPAKKKGRKPIVEKIDKEQIKKLALAGWTDQQIADFFKISRQAFNDMKKKNPAFYANLQDWKAEADAVVERSLFERAKGYTHAEEKIFCEAGYVTKVQTTKHYPPSEVACIFWLKNRQPDKWRDKVLNMNMNGNMDDPEFCDQFFGYHPNGNGQGGNGNGKPNGNGKH